MEVSDLFFGDYTEVVEGPWNDFDEKYPYKSAPTQCKVRVRLDNGDERDAYFFADRAAWAKYTYKPSYFWDVKTREPLHNVAYWKLMTDKKEAV